MQLLSPLRPCTVCAVSSCPQWDGGGDHWHSHWHSQAPKTKQQEGPSRSLPAPVPPGQARGTLASGFALTLRLVWDKTGCQYQVQATWHYYNRLENINMIKSCRDPCSPGCRSTRGFTALGTEGTALLHPASCNCSHRGASLAAGYRGLGITPRLSLKN